MTVVRAIARPLLSTIFVVQGINAVRKPEPLVGKAEPVAERMVPLIKKVAPQVGERLPEDTKNLVRLNGAAQVLGGLALATGTGRRLGATVLAATLVPTTLAEHRWWEHDDPTQRQQHRLHFMKNLGLLGGLMLAAVDTEGRPGLAWRASHGAQVTKRETGRAAKLAKRETGRATKLARREAKHAVKSARREAKLLAKSARAELPFD